MLIFFQIYKQSEVIKLSYKKQKLEHELAQLRIQKEQLIQNMYVSFDRVAVKKYASQKLALKPLKVNQIKKINYESHR